MKKHHHHHPPPKKTPQNQNHPFSQWCCRKPWGRILESLRLVLACSLTPALSKFPSQGSPAIYYTMGSGRCFSHTQAMFTGHSLRGAWLCHTSPGHPHPPRTLPNFQPKQIHFCLLHISYLHDISFRWKVSGVKC